MGEVAASGLGARMALEESRVEVAGEELWVLEYLHELIPVGGDTMDTSGGQRAREQACSAVAAR